jgi:hypothetical protein
MGYAPSPATHPNAMKFALGGSEQIFTRKEQIFFYNNPNSKNQK